MYIKTHFPEQQIGYSLQFFGFVLRKMISAIGYLSVIVILIGLTKIR